MTDEAGNVRERIAAGGKGKLMLRLRNLLGNATNLSVRVLAYREELRARRNRFITESSAEFGDIDESEGHVLLLELEGEEAILIASTDTARRLLVMTVEPGFGGQKFLDLCLPKIRRARALMDKHGIETWLQVDGGVSLETIERCAEAGADVFVAGSAVYSADDPDAMVASLRAAAEAAAGA